MEQSYFDFEEIKATPFRKKIAKELVGEIIQIAEKRLGKKSKEMMVLEVGCGLGLYTEYLSKKCRKVVAVEPYKKAFDIAKKNESSKIKVYNCKIENFNTSDRFDLVLSLTTIEHMPEVERSLKQIFKLMKNGDLIYLTAPNKLWPIESHYRLPFLSWLPLPLANLYLKITNKGESYEDCSYSKSYFGIKKLFNQLPCKYEFYLPDPNLLYLGGGSKDFTYNLIKRLGISLIRLFPFMWFFSKGFIILIQKTK